MPRLFCFGYGFTAEALARRLLSEGWSVAGTTRSAEKAEAMRAGGVEPVQWTAGALFPPEALEGADAVLLSIAPDEAGDPVLRCCAGALERAAPTLSWLGYLSTTGVYGDREGDLVDESADLRPETDRSRRRVRAEADWTLFATEHSAPLHIFRLGGIYGPGRSALDQVRAGTARRILKPGQVFNRIHVDDAAGALALSIATPTPLAVYNLVDDEPSAPGDPAAFAADLLGLDPPPEVPFEEAEMSAMARSFYADNKRVSNARLKERLGWAPRYPSYREGLQAILADAPGDPI
ncbi:MAG: SDR family oxidoreductase [Pseudomonadota bacterium]